MNVKKNLTIKQLQDIIRNNEYKIKVGDRDNYIDLLLYNIKYRCYVIVELKVTELKKEHIGQLKFYSATG